MLPNGQLAKHGYTKQWGFFEGTCIGSEHLPFEQDKSLVEQAIQIAQNQINGLNKKIKYLKTDTSPKAWLHLYRSGNYSVKGQYEWHEVELITYTRKLDDCEWVEFIFMCPIEGTQRKLNHYVINPTMPKVVRAMNDKYIHFLETKVNEIKKYIEWQRERIHNWNPQPLIPR